MNEFGCFHFDPLVNDTFTHIERITVVKDNLEYLMTSKYSPPVCKLFFIFKNSLRTLELVVFKLKSIRQFTVKLAELGVTQFVVPTRQ